jgi:hypothetical protein
MRFGWRVMLMKKLSEDEGSMIYDDDLGRIDMHIYSIKALVRSKHQSLFGQWFILKLHMSCRAVERWKDARCEMRYHQHMIYSSNTGLFQPAL